MEKIPKHILEKLNDRKVQGNLRQLSLHEKSIDFSSNDYLGLLQQKQTHSASFLGSAGSRLLSGNSQAHMNAEKKAASYFGNSCLLFNSGYQANLSILQAIPQRGDLIIYDEEIHASIKDGMRLSFAKNWSYAHNCLNALENKLQKARATDVKDIYILSEGVFSMSGNICPAKEILDLCAKYDAYFILDEAHSCGILGKDGKGIAFEMQTHPHLLARVFPLGKAFASLGCFVACSKTLKEYLINFARPFIYTTAFPSSVASLLIERINWVSQADKERKRLFEIINFWNSKSTSTHFSNNQSPIQFVTVERSLQEKISEIFESRGIHLLPVKYPTVPENKEGFRVILHAYNTDAEILSLINLLNSQW